MGKIKPLVIVFAILWSGIMHAQQCSLQLSGTVSDSETREKLEFAAVSIVETQKQAFTRSDGTFEFTNLCAGKYTLAFRHLGCKDTSISVTVGANTMVDMAMPHRLNQLKEVDIEAEWQNKVSSCVVQVLTVKSQSAPTVGSNLGDVVKQVEGVTVLQTGPTIAKPVINGFSGNRIVIMNNGVRLEGQQWGGEHAPEVDPNLSDRISIYNGAQAVKFGPDAIGGVITLDAAPLAYGRKIGGNAGLAYYTNNRLGALSGLLESGMGKHWAWRVQGTYRKGATVFTPGYGLGNTALREGDFSAAIGYKNQKWKVEAFMSRFDAKVGIFRGSHIGNLTDLQQAINSTTPFYTTNAHSYAIDRPWQDAVHYTAKLNAGYYINSSNKVSLQYAYQNNVRREYDRDKPLNDSLAALNRPEFYFNLTTQTLDAQYEYLGDALKITAGISGMLQNNRWDGRYFIPNFTAVNGGAFAIAQYRYKKWAAEAGLRYDVRYLQIARNMKGGIIRPSYVFKNPSAGLTVSYSATANLTLSTMLGIAWRPPTVSELYSNGLHHGAAAFEIGDTSFTAEVAYNANANITYFGKGVEFRLMALYTHFNNYINLEPMLPATLTIAGAFPTFKYKQVQAGFTSINFSAKVNVYKGLSVFTRNSLLWAYNYTTNNYLLNAPPHRFQLGFRYSFNDKRWFEKPYVEVSGNHSMRQYLVPQNTDYSVPPPAYTLLNIEAGFTAHIRNTHVNISIVASNVLNTRYRDYLDRFRYYTDAMGRNIAIKLFIPFGSSPYNN